MVAKMFIISLSMAFFIFGSGCSSGQDAMSDLEELKKTVDEFYAAIEEGRDSVRAEMFTEDAFMLPNHWGYTQGKEAITKMITGSEGWVFKLRDVNHIDMDVSGDIGYTVNEYYYTWHAEGEEPEWHKTKNIHIWKKQPDGTWKLHADLWNSSEPLRQPESEE